MDKAEFRELMQEVVKTGASLGEAGIMALLIEIRNGLTAQEELLGRLVELAESDYADDEERLPRSLGDRGLPDDHPSWKDGSAWGAQKVDIEPGESRSGNG